MRRRRSGFRVVMREARRLAEYRVEGENRWLVEVSRSARSDVFDVPADGVGACFWVGRAIPSLAAQEGLVADYLEQAQRVGAPPMSSAAIGTALGIPRGEDGGDGGPS